MIKQCKRGHEYTEENTYTNPQGLAHCRKCRRLARDRDLFGGKREAAIQRDKAKARQAVRYAIVSGKINKPNECTKCGASGIRIHGHHYDYSKPLDVIWVCPPCHAIEHGKKPAYTLEAALKEQS